MPSGHPPTYSSLSPIPLPRTLRNFQRITVTLALLSLAFHLIHRYALHNIGFISNPLSSTTERFGDLRIFPDKFAVFRTPAFFSTGFPINYPAPTILILAAIFHFTHYLRAYFTFAALILVIPATLFTRALIRRGLRTSSAISLVATTIFLSWPILFVLDRANVEIFVFLATLLAIWAYATQRLWLAAALFGIAASLKLFPFVYLALFLTRRDLPKLLFGIATLAVVTLLSLHLVGPSIPAANHGISSGIASFQHNYMATWRVFDSGVDHSLFGAYKTLAVLLFHHPAADFTTALSVYLALTSLGGLALYVLILRKLPPLNQLLALTIVSIYLTPFSGDYTLLHLYAPLALLFLLALQAQLSSTTIPGLAAILYSLALALSIETFLTLPAAPTQHYDVRLVGLAHAIALGTALIATLRHPLVSSDFTVAPHRNGPRMKNKARKSIGLLI